MSLIARQITIIVDTFTIKVNNLYWYFFLARDTLYCRRAQWPFLCVSICVDSKDRSIFKKKMLYIFNSWSTGVAVYECDDTSDTLVLQAFIFILLWTKAVNTLLYFRCSRPLFNKLYKTIFVVE